jgi:hypothetical protein
MSPCALVRASTSKRESPVSPRQSSTRPCRPRPTLPTVPGDTLRPPPVKLNPAANIQIRLAGQCSDRLEVERRRHGRHFVDRRRRHGARNVLGDHSGPRQLPERRDPCLLGERGQSLQLAHGTLALGLHPVRCLHAMGNSGVAMSRGLCAWRGALRRGLALALVRRFDEGIRAGDPTGERRMGLASFLGRAMRVQDRLSWPPKAT